MKQDRFLLAILLFILLLAASAVGVYFVRQEKAEYLPETIPENVAHNYVLALQKKEYQKAYSYLQQQDNTPTLSEFQETFLKQHRQITETALQIRNVTEQEGQATLDIIILHGGRSPFGSTWKEYNTALLVKESGNWKVAYFPAPYWGWDWDNKPRPVD